jgi:hypothetical protein
MLLLSGSPFRSTIDICGQHVSTDWQIARDEEFTDIIFESLEDSVNLEQILIDDSFISIIHARVRYRTHLCISDWSESEIYDISVTIIPDIAGQYLDLDPDAPILMTVEEQSIVAEVDGEYYILTIPEILEAISNASAERLSGTYIHVLPVTFKVNQMGYVPNNLLNGSVSDFYSTPGGLNNNVNTTPNEYYIGYENSGITIEDSETETHVLLTSGPLSMDEFSGISEGSNVNAIETVTKLIPAPNLTGSIAGISSESSNIAIQTYL